jgi:hypothetical protein
MTPKRCSAFDPHVESQKEVKTFAICANHGHPAVPRLYTLLLALVIGRSLAGSCCAGYGRQTLVVEADYSYEPVCRWIEKNVDAIQKSSGAKIVETRGDLVTLRLETKYGTQTFRIRRSGTRGDYRASFVDRSAGTLTNYSYRIQVTSLEGGAIANRNHDDGVFRRQQRRLGQHRIAQGSAIDADIFGREADQAMTRRSLLDDVRHAGG